MLGLARVWSVDRLLAARTPHVFGHSGIYITETATLFGAYDLCDYGAPASMRNQTRLPVGYEENRFLRFDFGGDAGLTGARHSLHGNQSNRRA